VERVGCGTTGGCFTEVSLHSSRRYHHEHSTEPSWLQVTSVWPLGAR
jgi:hypothetical protein